MGSDIKGKIKKAIEELCKIQEKNLERRKSEEKIYLGRMFSLGAWFQYLLAGELFKDTQYTVLVDCPVTINGRRQALYPDILVVDENTLKAVIDVKLDLGYVDPKKFGFKNLKRSDEFSYNGRKNEFFKTYNNFFKAKEFKYKLKDGHVVKDKIEIKIPRQVEKIGLLLMKEANNHDNYDGYKHAMEDAGFKLMHILSKGNVRHPDDKENMKLIEKEIAENSSIEQVLGKLIG